MFVRFPRSLVVVISLLVVLILLLPAGSLSSTATSAQPATGKVLRTSPVMFIENVGQFAEGARFQVHGGNYTLWLAEDALWITVVEPERGATEEQSNPAGLDSPLRTDPAALQPVNGVNIRLSFIGANPHPRLEPFDRLDTHVSYFRGNDPAQWHADVPVWGSARYVDLYSGVDLELTSEGGQMVQRLTVHPGADLSLVRLRVEGADAVAVDQNVVRLSAVAGEVAVPLLLTAGASGEAIVQPQGAQAFEVIAPFTQLPSKRPSTSENQLSPADHPEDLLYGTFLGGSDEDGGNAIAADGTGSVYVTGSTWSSDFPTTPGAFDTNLNGDTDAFVVKLNSAGSGLAYATFLGGNNLDYGNAITVDGAGNAYVTGDTCSSDFPVTLGAFDTSFNNDSGVSDAFVIKLNPAGSGLAYGTFLGSTSTDWAYAITVDGASNAYVTGETHYRDFPTTPGAFDTSFNSTYMPEAFVVKMNSAGSGLIYATFLGGSGEDGGHAIAVDGAGNAYVAGFTTYGYPPFPTTPGAFDTSFNGSYDSDAFVVKLNPGGSGLAYGTFLGGSGNERIIAIAIDDAGNVYVTGKTASSNFPTTLGAFDTSFNGGNTDAFVVKLNSAGSGLAYATFLGGNNLDDGNAIAVDWADNAYVAGTTGSSANFPLTVGALATVFGGATTDAFVARLDATGSQLTYSTFLGGIGLDDARDIALDPEGDVVHVTGQTFSSNFPLTANAFDSTLNYGDAFIVKLRLRGGPLIPTPTPTITPTPTSTPTSTPTPTNTPTATPGPSPTPTPTPPPPIVLYPHTDGWLRGYPASQVGSASVSSSQRSADWYYALSGPMSGNTYKLLELSLNPLSSACWACLDFKFISQTSVGGSERVLASTNRCVDGIGDLFSQTLNGESANGALLVFRMTWTSGTCAGTLTFGSPTFSRIEIPGVLPSTSTPTATPTATPSPTPTRTSTPTVTPTRTQTATPRAKVYLPLLLRNQ